MATQNSQPSHAGNNHGYPKLATTINPEPQMHSKPTLKSITHASNHHNHRTTTNPQMQTHNHQPNTQTHTTTITNRKPTTTNPPKRCCPQFTPPQIGLSPNWVEREPLT
jgi:hypothetical protein